MDLIEGLQNQVRMAGQEFHMAVSFHEVWKPAAYDADLRKRMGTSFATHGFHLIRIALRREVLLALMRMWGLRKDELRVKELAKQLREPPVFDALIKHRAKTFPFGEEHLRKSLQEHAILRSEITGRYSKGGKSEATLTYLKSLRNEHLAHRALARVEPEAAGQTGEADEKVEAFFQDMSKLVSELYTLVLGTAYSPNDTAEVYRFYARFFWEAARGERTEGHPSYRPAPPTGP